jgi:hypothetical protein
MPHVFTKPRVLFLGLGVMLALGVCLGGVLTSPRPGDAAQVVPYESGIVWEEPKKVQTDAPGSPPSDAIVLFDGKSMDAWKGGDKWTIENGEGIAKGVVSTKQPFGDCQLHVEFATPKEVKGSGQGRGNNGIGLMNARY